MVQLTGSAAFAVVAFAFICMGDPIVGFLAAACALVWAAAISEGGSPRRSRSEILRRL
jgi:hypothetical protein